ncbi:MAG: hypothetical protein H6515_14585 [Microthrixaceae bacterium]|jgi:hypothetical protein|nr:hypothetical protein [Microthrixaceae bacterium]
MTSPTVTPALTTSDAALTPVSGFTLRVLDALGPALLAQAGLLLRDLVGGLCTWGDVVDAGATATTAGWPAVFDLDATPWPATLAPLAGLTVATQTPPDTTRALIRHHSRRRGSAEQLYAAAQEAAPGRRIDLIERTDGDPDRAELRLYSGEATEADRAAVEAAVAPHKPVGVVLTVTRVRASYAHFTTHHGPTYTDEATEFGSYADLATHVPEPGTIP